MDPAFSIIVPVYQYWDRMPRLLRALEQQSAPADSFEILLVNNEAGFAGPYPALPANARILQCATPGSYAARNAGAAEAKGEWLAFTDADCIPTADWLHRLGLSMREGDALLAGEIRVVAEQSNPFAVYDAVRGMPQADYVAHNAAATANLAVRADAFRALGGFDQRRMSGGDHEFCKRAVAAGYSLRYVADAVVEHPARRSWGELASKSRRVQGGLLLFGPKDLRMRRILRTFRLPTRDIRKLIRAKEHSLALRLGAIGVALGLWGIGVWELLRLGLGAAPERR